MTTPTLLQKLRQLVQLDEQTDPAESLIGFFQAFRPHGEALDGVFEGLAGGDEFARRLRSVYQATAASERGDAFRDAYFIVRNPSPLEAAQAQRLAEDFLRRLADFSTGWAERQAADALGGPPGVRVLEGKPPKQPQQEDRCRLHQVLHRDLPQRMHDRHVNSDTPAALLHRGCYFIACDAWLRDYLLWPLTDGADDLDPFEPYFQLWRHGVKLRVFCDERVDIYLPRGATISGSRSRV